MHLTLILLSLLAAPAAYARPIHLQFEATVVESASPTYGQVGSTVRGGFWFATAGTPHLNTLIDFPGRELGFTFVAPAQSGGIRVEAGPIPFGTGPRLQVEMRNYDPEETDTPDELVIRARSIFQTTTIFFRGPDAEFFENSGTVIPQVPRFGLDTPFLPYSDGYIEVRDRRSRLHFLAELLPDTVAHYLLLYRGPGRALTGLPDPDDLAMVPEPSTALLLLLGLLGLSPHFRRLRTGPR